MNVTGGAPRGRRGVDPVGQAGEGRHTGGEHHDLTVQHRIGDRAGQRHQLGEVHA